MAVRFFTNHETRNTSHETRLLRNPPLEPRPYRLSRFWGHEIRDTEHETRLDRLGSLPAIPYDFPVFPDKKMCRQSSAPVPSGSRAGGFMDASSRRASAPGLHVPPRGEARCVRVTRHECQWQPKTAHFLRDVAGGAKSLLLCQRLLRNSAVRGAFLLRLIQCPSTVNRSGWASRRAPLAGKSHKSAQNPGSPRKMRETQRSLRLPLSSGLVPLRRPPSEPMPGKENVPDCVGTGLRHLPDAAALAPIRMFPAGMIHSRRRKN